MNEFVSHWWIILKEKKRNAEEKTFEKEREEKKNVAYICRKSEIESLTFV
jgi:hypothetical protein